MDRPASRVRSGATRIRPRRRARSQLATLAFLALVPLAGGCADLKSAGLGTDTDGGAVTPPAGDTAGPGAHGSLPSGYCCTTDSECRNRHCADVGTGGKMCLDHCYSNSPCTRRDVAFTCDSPDGEEEGYCQPPSPAFTCIPQASFARGARAVGECCEATGDGNAGEECEGNLCDAKGINGEDGPFVCTQWCDLTRDCPSGTICNPLHWCEPANFPYTCK